MTTFTMFVLIPSLVVLVGAVVLSASSRQENVVSLAAGAAVALYLGLSELAAALAAGIGSTDGAQRLAASIALTGSAALFVRLIVQRRARSRSAEAISG
jgi:hypothetical protein